MKRRQTDLEFVLNGWAGHNRSIIAAISELQNHELRSRPIPDMRSIGELLLHIADGRVDWFRRIAPDRFSSLQVEVDNRGGSPPESYDVEALQSWLEKTFSLIEVSLAEWTIQDLQATFVHAYQGKQYAVSRQWVIFRILTHDMHHGGQLSEMLAMIGKFPLELTILGGHITEPPTIDQVPA